MVYLQNAHISKLGKDWTATLERRRQRSLQMVKNFHAVANIVKANGGDVCFEWPRKSHGWKKKEVQDLINDPELQLRKVYCDG